MELNLLQMAAEHVEAVAALERESFTNPWSEASIAGELDNPLAVYRVAAERVTGELAGYAGMHHVLDEGHITNIAVADKYRRRGIASSLLGELIGYAVQNRLRLLTLEARPSNMAAVALYGGFGFEPAGRRKNYYRGPVEDALILTLALEGGGFFDVS